MLPPALDAAEGRGLTRAFEKLWVCDRRMLYFERMSGHAGMAAGLPPASIVRWRA